MIYNIVHICRDWHYWWFECGQSAANIMAKIGWAHGPESFLNKYAVAKPDKATCYKCLEVTIINGDTAVERYKELESREDL